MILFLFVLLALVALVGLFLVRSDRDAVAVLTIYLVALFGINARWVIPGTGAIGTPAMVIAIIAAWWWWISRANSSLSSDADPNPIRVILLGYLWFIALSWGLSRLRLLSMLEVNGSNRALLTAIGLTGVALVVSDGVRTRARLETLLKRVVMGGAAISMVGLLQFFAEIDLVATFQFPGLAPNGEAIQALATRADFSRAEGTTLHSIEFSAVLAMILPLAIHFAMNGRDRRERRRYAVMAGLIGVAVPLSVSRTGLVALAVALLIMAIAWNWRQRITGLVVAGLAALVMGVAVPGLVGTFRWLVFGASEDPSVTARLDRVPLVMEQVSEKPWLGWGVGTFSPDEDFLLDNQYFGTLIETGVVGLLVVVALILTAMTLCYLTFRRSEDDDTRRLATAIMAGIAVLPVVMYLFDAFFYSILMGVSFLLIGSAAALWRLALRDTERGAVLEPQEPYRPPVLRSQPEAAPRIGGDLDLIQATAVIEPHEAYRPPILRSQPEAAPRIGGDVDVTQPTAVIELHEAYRLPILRRQPEAAPRIGGDLDVTQPTAVIGRTTQCKRIYADGHRCPNRWVTSQYRRDKRYCSRTCRSAVRVGPEVEGIERIHTPG